MREAKPIGSAIVFVLSMITLGGLLWLAYNEKQQETTERQARFNKEEISPNDYYWVSFYINGCPAVEPTVAALVKNDGIIVKSEYNTIASEYDKLCLEPKINKYKIKLQEKYGK